MATTTKTLLPTASHTDLVITSPQVSLPANVLHATIRMVSTEFTDPALTCELKAYISVDGGQTFANIAGLEAIGGFYTRPNDPRLGQPLQPRIDADFAQPLAASLVYATWASKGTWVYGLVLDLET
jgi:hypothetical protein